MDIKSQVAVILFKIFGKVPLSVSRFVGKALGLLSYWLPNREKRVSRINLEAVFPDISKKNRDLILKNSLVSTAMVLLESIRIWHLDFNSAKKIIISPDTKLLEEAHKKRKGIILALPHFSLWESINPIVKPFGPVSVIYRKSKNPQMDKIIKAARSRFGITMVANDVKGVMALKKALDRKEMVVILPDHDPGDKGGVIVDFFNIPANTSTLLPKLAQKTKATVIFAHASREAKGFSIHLQKASAEIHNHDLNIAARAMNKDIETIIRQSPEQYIWSAKRFRTQEDGSDFYR